MKRLDISVDSLIHRGTRHIESLTFHSSEKASSSTCDRCQFVRHAKLESTEIADESLVSYQVIDGASICCSCPTTNLSHRRRSVQLVHAPFTDSSYQGKHRCKQLAELGIQGAAGIIERRPETFELRIGIVDVEVLVGGTTPVSRPRFGPMH